MSQHVSPHNPLVSIVIPCYEQQASLQKTLESCLNQTYENLEIIVVDDGSSAPITYPQGLGSPDSRVKLVRQKNTGVAGARNKGISLAGGQYIKFLDSDDALTSNCVRSQLLGGIDDNTVSLCGFTLTLNGKKFTGVSKFDTFFEGALIGHIAPIHCGLFPLKLVKAVGGFTETGICKLAAEDYDFYLKLAFTGCNAVTVHEPSALYHKSQGGRSTLGGNHVRACIDIASAHLRSYFDSQATLPSEICTTVLSSMCELAVQSECYDKMNSLLSDIHDKISLSKSDMNAQKLGIACKARLATSLDRESELFWARVVTLCPPVADVDGLVSPGYAMRVSSPGFSSHLFDGPALANALAGAATANTIWLWGRGVWCRYWLQMLAAFQLDNIRIIDSYAGDTQSYLGRPCMSPDNVAINQDDVLIVCSREHYHEITHSAAQKGWADKILHYVAGQ